MCSTMYKKGRCRLSRSKSSSFSLKMNAIALSGVIFTAYLFALVATDDYELEENLEEGENAEETSKIIGGYYAQQGMYPWMVALYRNNTFQCSGFVISRNAVLTAAHCIVMNSVTQNISSYSGLVGNVNRTAADIRLRFEQVIVHPKYSPESPPGDSSSLVNDIAVLKTKGFIPLGGKIQSLCIKGPYTKSANASKAIAMGWGRTNPFEHPHRNEYHNVLKYTEYFIDHESSCSNFTGGDKGKLCVSAYRTGICVGDAGSPLVQKHLRTKTNMAIGIASHGTCNRDDIPDIYMKSDYYLDFIEKHVENKVACEG